ncbi:MAG TPA: flagellar biosynthesis repressor FlbT [Acidocella sp.]|jgi:flagellar protein FlbT|nr:flagellar biosynthesis repressor FlbT [Acidocella sp.]OYV53063.1 MAG: flagellar biosynthesis repressor FlbT [Acidocella sp. 20-58-15]OYY03476.1 MAG: flagellar biosynthesis repressor FlbT [Acidocella sp. 35-58-6]HQT39074.1 flagellar biosynthesis repressor FlbT [Acidocella sp.]
MAGLVVELKQNEMIIIDGAAIRFRTKSRVEITGKARFLYGKQILLPEDANTPAALIYLAVQTAYIGSFEERTQAIDEARTLITQFRYQTKSALARDILDKIIEQVEAQQCYEALKLVRRIMQHEAALMEVRYRCER